MDKKDYLGLYAKGWSEGDVNSILHAADAAYVFNDPNAGRISKADFATYFSGLKQAVAALQGTPRTPFMELSEVVTSEEGGVLTAWCWWSIPGTRLEGSGLIKVGDSGVLSERIAFYTKLLG